LELEEDNKPGQYWTFISQWFSHCNITDYVRVEHFPLSLENIRRLNTTVPGVIVAIYCHGRDQKLVLGKEKNAEGKEVDVIVPSEEIAKLVKDTGIDLALIHLGGCESFPKDGVSKKMVTVVGNTPISGYTTATLYDTSSAFEVLFFNEMLNYDRTAKEAYNKLVKKNAEFVKNTGFICYEK
jgi:hypothetical protein